MGVYGAVVMYNLFHGLAGYGRDVIGRIRVKQADPYKGICPQNAEGRMVCPIVQGLEPQANLAAARSGQRPRKQQRFVRNCAIRPWHPL